MVMTNDKWFKEMDGEQASPSLKRSGEFFKHELIPASRKTGVREAAFPDTRVRRAARRKTRGGQQAASAATKTPGRSADVTRASVHAQ